ncbi:MAG: CRISPR-associated endonuclease Cas1 [Desulfurellaceae bacterium]|nr:CRISPR-associated endonuclease Cas1 [Desulfurellaceae bacterium]
MTEINEFQHPDSIWTWKSNRRGGKATLWLPYVSQVEKLRKNTWRFSYNGGEVDTDLSKLDCVMFYGASGQIPVTLIDELAVRRVPLLVHRRNIGRPAIFLPAPRADSEDILTKQIITRTNRTKRVYIARTLVRERFRAVEHKLPTPSAVYGRLARARSLGQVRVWEAEQSRRYWRIYFSQLGHPNVTRREKGPLAAALDAGSMFLAGVILRWLLIHRLSPSHGFLHEGTDYMGLVYDLMEPARYMIEEALAAACGTQSVDGDSDMLTKASLSMLKNQLEKVVYVPATRQRVRRKNLLHGNVLALRAYLTGDMRRLVIPSEGERKGGRPPKVSYRLPGDMPVR